MKQEDHDAHDAGLVDGLTGENPKHPFNHYYMDGWYEGRNEVMDEMLEVEMETNDIKTMQDLENEHRLETWRKINEQDR